MFIASQAVVTILLLATNAALEKLVQFIHPPAATVLGFSLDRIWTVTFEIAFILIMLTFVFSLLVHFFRRAGHTFSQDDAE